MVKKRPFSSQEDMMDDRELKTMTFHFHDAWFGSICEFSMEVEDESADNDDSSDQSHDSVSLLA